MRFELNFKVIEKINFFSFRCSWFPLPFARNKLWMPARLILAHAQFSMWGLCCFGNNLAHADDRLCINVNTRHVLFFSEIRLKLTIWKGEKTIFFCNIYHGFLYIFYISSRNTGCFWKWYFIFLIRIFVPQTPAWDFTDLHHKKSNITYMRAQDSDMWGQPKVALFAGSNKESS